ncbi:3-deoxy-manno-octulosonate cytidylyltransferase [Bacteroidales bacterium]|nr:3-deoxy-manno-octulosonate cytidylyltransferase [Bacteroidales bacterium]
MKFLGIIPARYASTRFPGKPLADMLGKPMIQRVYEQVVNELDDLYVATDNELIFETVRSFGGKAVMTSPLHQSGTDRCYEAFEKIGKPFDVLINIQGDEPFIQAQQIALLKSCFDQQKSQIATLAKAFTDENKWEEVSNPNTPKVIFDQEMQAIYFSRSVIPFYRDASDKPFATQTTYYKHIGIYAYRADILKKITSLKPSKLEKIESLEQLRWIENNYTIRIAITQQETMGIDSPEDMEIAIKKMTNEIR